VTGRLDGKVTLISGAARGIGAAIARRFAAEGARLLLTDAEEDGVRSLAAELGARSERLDVTSEEAWEGVAGWANDAHGRLDVLVNNAGVFLAAPLHETSLEDFRRLQEVNQVGVFLGMRTIAPLMTDRGVAKELAAAGVRVNSLHPGQIDTDMHTRQAERTPELIAKLVAGIPMQRIGTPQEVADAAVFLAADESRYVTGSEIVVDGGVSG
jgi:3alpha(or 20beta)-hydroxysteroid dehydrogenase